MVDSELGFEARMHLCAENSDEQGLRLMRAEDRHRFDREVARVKNLNKARDYLSPLVSQCLTSKTKRQIRDIAYQEKVAQKKREGLNV